MTHASTGPISLSHSRSVSSLSHPSNRSQSPINQSNQELDKLENPIPKPELTSPLIETSSSSSSPSPTLPLPIDRVSDWPPIGSFPISLMILSAVMLLLFGYTCYVMREEVIIDRYEFIMWGGPMDRLVNLQKLRKYLIYDYLGLEVIPRMIRFGLASAVLGCLFDPNPEIQRLASQVLCGYTSNLSIRPKLIELDALFYLRRLVDTSNPFIWYAIGNLAQDQSSILTELASDSLVMASLFDRLTQDQIRSNYQLVRPMMALLSYLVKYPSSCAILASNHKEEIEKVLKMEYIFEPMTLFHSYNMRFHLSQNEPHAFPSNTQDVQNYGVIEQTPNQLLQTTLSLQVLTSLSIGTIWAACRTSYLKSKFSPLTMSERLWLRRSLYWSPITSSLLAISLYGLERLTTLANNYLDYESFRDIRKVSWIYMLQLPLYWIAIRWAGPFCILPSLVRLRYDDQKPPIHLMYSQEATRFLEDLGILSDPFWEPVDSGRGMSSMANLALEDFVLKKKIQSIRSNQHSWWKFWAS